MENERSRRRTLIGSPYWLAPEVISVQVTKEERRNEAAKEEARSKKRRSKKKQEVIEARRRIGEHSVYSQRILFRSLLSHFSPPLFSFFFFFSHPFLLRFFLKTSLGIISSVFESSGYLVGGDHVSRNGAYQTSALGSRTTAGTQ